MLVASSKTLAIQYARCVESIFSTRFFSSGHCRSQLSMVRARTIKLNAKVGVVQDTGLAGGLNDGTVFESEGQHRDMTMLFPMQCCLWA